MYTINGENIQDAMQRTLKLFGQQSYINVSVEDGVRMLPDPITVSVRNPRQRFVTHPVYDQNPFYVFDNALAVLGGQGIGERLRVAFEYDQLHSAIKGIQNMPHGLPVLQFYKPSEDLHNGFIPLMNSIVLRKISNTLYAYVHSYHISMNALPTQLFIASFIQEYAATALGLNVGAIRSTIDFPCIRQEIYEQIKPMSDGYDEWAYDNYAKSECDPFPMGMKGQRVDLFDNDLVTFLQEPTAIGFNNSFFRKIAKPMFLAHEHLKGQLSATGGGMEVGLKGCMEIAQQLPTGSDYRLAVINWCERSLKRLENEQQNS